MNQNDRGTTWQYLEGEVRDGGYPVPTHAAHDSRDRGFRLVYDGPRIWLLHRGGSFRDNQNRVRWIRVFEWPGEAEDEILSFRLVHDREGT
jgi:hypothetical protein